MKVLFRKSQKPAQFWRVLAHFQPTEKMQSEYSDSYWRPEASATNKLMHEQFIFTFWCVVQCVSSSR
jgi:hypothetical protein